MVDTAEVASLQRDIHGCAGLVDQVLMTLRGALWRLGLGGRGEAMSGAALRECVQTAISTAALLGLRLRERETALAHAVRAYDGAERMQWWHWDALLDNLPGSRVPVVPSPAEVMQYAAGAGAGNAVPSGRLAASYASKSWIAGLGTWFTRTEGFSDDPLEQIGSIELTPVPTGDGPVPNGSFTSVAERVKWGYTASRTGESAIDLQRIEHADDSVSWIVSIPGTMGGWNLPGTSVPFSWHANVPAYLGLATGGDALVAAAMTRAGIGPQEPVLLVGHSQGGMTAVQLALEDSVLAKFTIAGVVTLGSPVAHMPAPEVPVLHVQHAEDGVPALSGQVGSRPEGPASGEVVVVRELGDDVAGSSPHDVVSYAATLGLLAAAGHPGMRRWDRTMARLWAEPGARVTAQTYSGRQR